MKKRIIALTFIIMLVISSSISLPIAARASRYIDSYHITVRVLGDGVVRVEASMLATHSRMTRVGFPIVTLYEINGSTATIIECHTLKYNPKAEAGSYGYYFSYNATPGKQYYAYASFVAEDADGGDSRKAFSATVTAE